MRFITNPEGSGLFVIRILSASLFPLSPTPCWSVTPVCHAGWAGTRSVGAPPHFSPQGPSDKKFVNYVHT